MRWSKIRRELHDRLADNLKGKLDYHMTTYKNSTGYIGRAWMTFKGEELVIFSNQDSLNQFDSLSNASVGTIYPSHEPIHEKDRTEGRILEKGEFSKYDFGETAWRFINTDIDTAINSDNAVMRALAVVDRRTGQRRLETMKNMEQHPMVLGLIELRVSTVSNEN